jgi:prepilin-type N-terminal cleavage/methylation domain-containing protein
MRLHETGVTLIELMIVLLISALLTAAIYAAFISQQKSYAIQTGVTDMQQNARAALTLMERDLRMAGFCVGDSGFSVRDYWDNEINSAITITDNTSPTPDQITVVYAARQVSTVASIVGNTVTLDSGGDQFDTGTDNKQCIAFETLRTVYTITGISGNELTLGSTPPANLADMRSTETPSGAQAYLVKAITYQVDDQTDPARPTLERVDSTDATAPDTEDLWDDIAGYVTDLQIEYPYDPGTGPSDDLLRVTLTSTLTDHEGTARTREHQAVMSIRNNGL